MTIQEARRHGAERLSAIYPTGEASTINDWVIEHITGLRMTERAANPRKELTPEQASAQHQYLERLLTHEPVQYVLGEAWFCGLKFKVNPNVLIPRAETEELVEWVITHCRFPLSQMRILDIGTGSGCIAISLKRRLGKAEVWACDLSEGAIDLARENAQGLGVEVNFVELDFLSSPARANLPHFDIIISNPPYIPEKDKLEMQPNVLDYEPHLALFVPDEDALLFYKAIADFGKTHLQEEGRIYMEIHEGLGLAVRQHFEVNGFSTKLKKDMQGKDRMIKAERSGVA